MPSVKSAILFPGQGSQEKGMGRNLAEKQTQAMELWKKAEKTCGHPLREIFWDGTQQDMSRTDYLQPALTVVNLTLWYYFRNRFEVAAMAGHSLGEYCALCSSGIIEVEETLKLVSLRGRLMAESGNNSEGVMTAVLKLDQAHIQKLTRKITRDKGQMAMIANYNTPRQFVVSGHLNAVKNLESLVKEAGGRSVRLPVSGAFHSPLMDEAALELAKMMNKIPWKTPFCDVFFNSTARPEKDPEKIKKLMQKQMTSPVHFTQLITGMKQKGINRFIEIGPKGVLSRMVPQILGSSEDISVMNISSPEDGDKLRAVNE